MLTEVTFFTCAVLFLIAALIMSMSVANIGSKMNTNASCAFGWLIFSLMLMNGIIIFLVFSTFIET